MIDGRQALALVLSCITTVYVYIRLEGRGASVLQSWLLLRVGSNSTLGALKDQIHVSETNWYQSQTQAINTNSTIVY